MAPLEQLSTDEKKCPLIQRHCSAGVKLILTPYTSALFNKAGMLAMDGRCKTLDAAANGYVRGEACSALSMQLILEQVRPG